MLKNKYFILFFLLINSLCLSQSVHLTLGTPTDNDPSDDYIIIREQYALSYNFKLNACNWVSWEHNLKWLGESGRTSHKFYPDPLLPTQYQYIVRDDDYLNSGWDRGHIVPSRDRTSTIEDNQATFYLTNVLPQHKDLNRHGAWSDLERYVEKLCLDGKQLFIIAGGIFRSNNKLNGKVAIPDSCFKIVVILEKDQQINDIDECTEIIATIMPNNANTRGMRWYEWTTTVTQLERSTGYKFLDKIKK